MIAATYLLVIHLMGAQKLIVGIEPACAVGTEIVECNYETMWACKQYNESCERNPNL